MHSTAIIIIVHLGECSELANPTNGAVSVTSVTQGSIATYSCNSGYYLNGSFNRICQANGTWGGSDPTCKRTLKKLIMIWFCNIYFMGV